MKNRRVVPIQDSSRSYDSSDVSEPVGAAGNSHGARRREESYPPDKGGKGGYVPYDPALTAKARQNRKNPTPAENKLWFEVLQDKRFAGLKFTRQKPLDKYIADFYCAALMLAIEIDGDSHAEQVDYDGQRTSRLNQLGVEVIRYANGEILTNLDGVYEDLSKRIRERRDEPPESPLSLIVR